MCTTSSPNDTSGNRSVITVLADAADVSYPKWRIENPYERAVRCDDDNIKIIIIINYNACKTCVYRDECIPMRDRCTIYKYMLEYRSPAMPKTIICLPWVSLWWEGVRCVYRNNAFSKTVSVLFFFFLITHPKERSLPAGLDDDGGALHVVIIIIIILLQWKRRSIIRTQTRFHLPSLNIYTHECMYNNTYNVIIIFCCTHESRRFECSDNVRRAHHVICSPNRCVLHKEWNTLSVTQRSESGWDYHVLEPEKI